MLISLSIRLGVVVSELERLPLTTIAEYIAVLRKDAAPTEPTLVDDLMKVFGPPSKRR